MRAPLLQPERLRRARQLRGLTQQELAEKAGLSTNSIGLYETGAVDPTPSSLIRLAEALDLTVLELSPMPVLPVLADVRGRLGVTPTEMAERLGVSRPTVERVEAGRLGTADPSMWAAAYGMDVDQWRQAQERGR